MKRLCAWLVFCIALHPCSARTVIDQLGRTVQVPEHPHRLVCLMPSVVDDVYPCAQALRKLCLARPLRGQLERSQLDDGCGHSLR
jgi:ABC-type Fe3+-hydroxamate transport system substrate-binding protein